MIAPRFTIRTILAIMAVAAIFFLLVGMGLRGHFWPAGVAIALGSFALMGGVYAALFAVLAPLASWYEQQQSARLRPVKVARAAAPVYPDQEQSPFATQAGPKQQEPATDPTEPSQQPAEGHGGSRS